MADLYWYKLTPFFITKWTNVCWKTLFSHIFTGSVENKHFWSLAFTQCTWREGFKKFFIASRLACVMPYSSRTVTSYQKVTSFADFKEYKWWKLPGWKWESRLFWETVFVTSYFSDMAYLIYGYIQTILFSFTGSGGFAIHRTTIFWFGAFSHFLVRQALKPNVWTCSSCCN